MILYKYKAKRYENEQRNKERTGRPLYALEEDEDFYVIWIYDANHIFECQMYGPKEIVAKNLRVSDISLLDYCKRESVNGKVEELEMTPGCFHRRIWRPCKVWYKNALEIFDISKTLIEMDNSDFKQSIISINGLIKKLKEIFYTVYPSEDNQSVYGHEIRNLLLLACMEVETELAGILRTHCYSGSRLTTNDYIKLKDILMLEDYEVKLTFYEESTIQPFSGWDQNYPTSSLEWYDAYNKTKHDRNTNFSEATLKHVISALAASLIVLYAQYGPVFQQKLDSSEFIILKKNDFADDDIYIPLKDNNWTATVKSI